MAQHSKDESQTPNNCRSATTNRSSTRSIGKLLVVLGAASGLAGAMAILMPVIAATSQGGDFPIIPTLTELVLDYRCYALLGLVVVPIGWLLWTSDKRQQVALLRRQLQIAEDRRIAALTVEERAAIDELNSRLAPAERDRERGKFIGILGLILLAPAIFAFVQTMRKGHLSGPGVSGINEEDIFLLLYSPVALIGLLSALSGWTRHGIQSDRVARMRRGENPDGKPYDGGPPYLDD